MCAYLPWEVPRYVTVETAEQLDASFCTCPTPPSHTRTIKRYCLHTIDNTSDENIVSIGIYLFSPNLERGKPTRHTRTKLASCLRQQQSILDRLHSTDHQPNNSGRSGVLNGPRRSQSPTERPLAPPSPGVANDGFVERPHHTVHMLGARGPAPVWGSWGDLANGTACKYNPLGPWDQLPRPKRDHPCLPRLQGPAIQP